MENNNINQLIKIREKRIQILYRFFLLENDSIKIKKELLDDFQLKLKDEKTIQQLITLIENIENYENEIIPFLGKDWSWNRIPKIIKSILVNGVYELENKLTPKAVIIDQSILLTRKFLPSWETKFINAILDNFN